MKAFVLRVLPFAFLTIPGAHAEPKEILRNLSGCFKVTYRFVEDGARDTRFDDWQGAEYFEWIPLKETESVLRLQHYGIAGGKAMKHWLEEWTETPEHSWKQKVYNPAGTELRYECTAPVRFNQWRCRTDMAAKPFIRDRNRTDYETLERENTLQITPLGWIQVEVNNKVDKNGVTVSNEVGWNEYLRVDETRCESAKKMAGE
jgi:hypothetical protein